MMTHDQADEILAALALDAVEEPERRELEAHLNVCPRCASELVVLREVAAALGHSVEPVPENVWSLISSQLVVPEREEPSTPRLRIVTQTWDSSVGGALVTTPRSRSARRVLMVTTSVAAAAVAATVVLSLSLIRTSAQNDELQAQLGSTSASVVVALETPGHTIVNLHSANHAQMAQLVLLPTGRGYLVSSSLPRLSNRNTYQLWGVIGGQAISLGLLGPSPGQATFTVAGADTPSQLGVTVEPAGGSVVPTSAMLASGTTQA